MAQEKTGKQMIENLKWVLPIAGVFLGWLIRKYDWLRLRPKEKVEVLSTEQDIVSKKVDDDIKVSKMAIELTIQLTAQLDKANAVIDRLQLENERLHRVINDIREEFGHRIDELEKALEDSSRALDEERKHCDTIRKELDEIKSKYGLK